MDLSQVSIKVTYKTKSKIIYIRLIILYLVLHYKMIIYTLFSNLK